MEAGNFLQRDLRRAEQQNEDVDRQQAVERQQVAESDEHIIQFFAYAHLPPRLQEVSRPFKELALLITGALPFNPEREMALRKLLEAKDAAVRALVAK